MRPYFILSTFRAAGGYVSPPGLWTPTSDKEAERLVAAKCIRPATDGELRRFGAEATEPAPDVEIETPAAAEQDAAGEQATEPAPKAKPKGKPKPKGSRSRGGRG